MTYAELDDDALRLEVAKRCGWTNVHMTKRIGLRGRCPQGWDDSVPNYTGRIYEAIALLDGMTYPDGVSVEYAICKDTYSHIDNIDPLPAPVFEVKIFRCNPISVYDVTIFGRNPISDVDYRATADTLPRAACEAWLMWDDGKEAQHEGY